ncbi:MAG: sugar transferase, partial [Planctomycetes bacterium]|nr:sugar transferase [Planctomycetota bacterium]
SPGPVLFAHRRLGRDGRWFSVWKFRTMVIDADRKLAEYLAEHPELQREWQETHKLKSDPRITRVGRFLRRSSLDELPQIWSVLTGRMSLVGPRPIVADEVVKYGDAYALYTSVPPGITGLWQVSGRNNTTYPQRVALDAAYVRNWSIWLDLYVLYRTVKTVLRREGAC